MEEFLEELIRWLLDAWIGVTCYSSRLRCNEIGHVLKANIWLLVIKNLKTPQPYWELGLGKRSHGSVLSPVVVFLISNHTIPPSSQCFVSAGTSNASTHDQDVLFSLFNDKMPRLDVLLGASVVSASEQTAYLLLYYTTVMMTLSSFMQVLVSVSYLQ